MPFVCLSVSDLRLLALQCPSTKIARALLHLVALEQTIRSHQDNVYGGGGEGGGEGGGGGGGGKEEEKIGGGRGRGKKTADLSVHRYPDQSPLVQD